MKLFVLINFLLFVWCWESWLLFGEEGRKEKVIWSTELISARLGALSHVAWKISKKTNQHPCNLIYECRWHGPEKAWTSMPQYLMNLINILLNSEKRRPCQCFGFIIYNSPSPYTKVSFGTSLFRNSNACTACPPQALSSARKLKWPPTTGRAKKVIPGNSPLSVSYRSVNGLDPN